MTTTVDDSNGIITYSCPPNTPPADDWGTYGDTSAYDGSYHYSYGANCSMEFPFSGRAVRVVGGSWFQTGVFSCSIDSGMTSWYNSWNGNAKLYNQTACFYDGLTSGNHTIQMTTAPLAGRQLIIDAIEVTPAGFGSPSPTVSSDSPSFALPSLIVSQIVTSTPGPSHRECNSNTVVGLAASLGVVCLLLSLVVVGFLIKLRPQKVGPRT